MTRSAALRPGVSLFLHETGTPWIRSSALLSRGAPTPLDCDPAVHLVVGQQFRINRDDRFEAGPFRVSTVEYCYRFETPSEEELFTFPWTPEKQGAEVTRPHLHIGNRLMSDTAPQALPNVYRLHVPTGSVSIEAVVRFALEDLGCSPSRNDWRSILDDGEKRFSTLRRPGSL